MEPLLAIFRAIGDPSRLRILLLVKGMELAVGASPAWDHEAFLAGKLTPVFFGSGVNNFGVMEVLDALVDMAPPPGPRVSTLEVNKQPVVKTIQPEDEGFAGVVFKVQANMDANHRDRIAFVRVASGKYTPGMKLKVQRTSKELRPTSVVTFMSQRREAVEEDVGRAGNNRVGAMARQWAGGRVGDACSGFTTQFKAPCFRGSGCG